MMRPLSQWVPQPLTGIVASGFGLTALLYALSTAASNEPFKPGWLLLAVFLTGTLVLAARYPIHLRHNIKLTVTSVPMYLIAVLLPPPLAALTGAVAMFTMGLVLRSKLKTLPSDIATLVGRWTVIAYVGSMVAHLDAQGLIWQVVGLTAAAGIMFVGDILTASFEIAPMSHEPPWRVARVLFREMTLAESVQYLIGILGAVVALREPWALLLFAVPSVVVYYAFKDAKEMHESTRRLLEGMADAVDLRDPYTGGHSRRVAEFCKGILNTLQVSGQEADLILSAARVHDIGKISIPDALLNKPGALTAAERATMQAHTAAGATLVSRYHDFQRGKDIVLHHHEHWNGQGYPARLKGLDIPLGSRIIAVADSFDAMTSDRPYRKAMTIQQAVDILRKGRGEQWDARIVDAFLVSLIIPAPSHSAFPPLPDLIPQPSLALGVPPVQAAG